VFGELLTVFNCSVLSFGVEIKFHLNRNLEYVAILIYVNSVFQQPTSVCIYAESRLL
jgi:hypothetical protein